MKKITITVPDNCELKQDGNTYTIVEKEKKLTYKDVAKKLFNNCCCYIDSDGSIKDVKNLSASPNDLTNCVTRRQAKKLLAINQLMNVAKYLNGDWQPDWFNESIAKYFIHLDKNENIKINFVVRTHYSSICFKSEELAQQAIEILGEETIKLALCTDY